MSDWLLRPRVEASLLNPALIGMSIAYAAMGYQRDNSQVPMPWPMAFLIPPIILHRPTRNELPSDIRTHFATWVTRHPLLVAGFPRRARVMAEPTREGLRLAIRSGRLNLVGASVVPTSLGPQADGELRQLLRASTLVGRWLARLDQPSTAFALLGVTP
jgi:hypothetical protein